MTRVCCWCGKTIGEKCGQCGAEARPVPERSGFFACARCSRVWRAGDQETGGMCEACAEEQKQQRAAVVHP